jgi:bacterioferritin
MANMTKEKLVELLNTDLANEYQAVIMYTTYAAAVSGPHRPALRSFFQAEIPDELGHAQFLADKIVSLGGAPTVTPVAVPTASAPREMLENVLRAEQRAIAGYKERAEQAAAFGDIGLSTHLETMVEDETGHCEETQKILRGWQ